MFRNSMKQNEPFIVQLRRKLFLPLLLLLSFLYFACETDTNDNTNVPDNNVDSIDLSTFGHSAYNKLRYLGDDEGTWFLVQEISSDEACIPTRGPDWWDGGEWINMHQHTWTDEDPRLSNMWGAFWEGITECNSLLDSLNSLTESDQVLAKTAELETLRAFYYYLVIDNYGDAPYLTSYENAPDLPMKESRENIFNNIVESLESNLPLLEDIDIKHKVNKYMAYALLSKLYLNAEVYTGASMWTEAEQYIDEVLNGPYMLDPNLQGPFLTNNDFCTENIFVIPYDEDTLHGFRIHMRSLFYEHDQTYDMEVMPWNGFCAMYDHFSTYSDDDLRKDIYFIYGPQYTSSGSDLIDDFTGSQVFINPEVPALYMNDSEYSAEEIRHSGARLGKYEIGAKTNLSNNFPLFRLSDFYLMKAEIALRNGGNADSWINEIRNRAGLPDMVGTDLESLLAERERELFCEGHRRQDLIRFGKFNDAWWEKAASGTDRNVFPIPKWATDANPNLLIDP